MAEQLLPDTIGAQLADFDRRLRNLESTARVGLSRIQTAETAGPNNGPALDLVGTYGNLSPVGPLVVAATGTKAIVFGSAQIYLAPAAVIRNSVAKISYAVSGATTINPDILSPCGLFSHDLAATTYDSATVTFLDVVTLNPGQNTFTMKFAYDGATGVGTASSTFINMVIVVIPVDL